MIAPDGKLIMPGDDFQASIDLINSVRCEGEEELNCEFPDGNTYTFYRRGAETYFCLANEKSKGNS